MLEIDVYFGLNAIGDATDVIVQPDPSALHSGDDVFWHFHSLDKNVDYVVIEFGDTSAEFFDVRKKKKSNKRKAELEKANPARGGHGHIVGTAPSHGGGTQSNKYTITAYDGDPDTAGSSVLYEADPTVITCDP
jgi:hypothetical protein